jgi:hypothetical protein
VGNSFDGADNGFAGAVVADNQPHIRFTIFEELVLPMTLWIRSKPYNLLRALSLLNRGQFDIQVLKLFF